MCLCLRVFGEGVLSLFIYIVKLVWACADEATREQGCYLVLRFSLRSVKPNETDAVNWDIHMYMYEFMSSDKRAKEGNVTFMYTRLDCRQDTPIGGRVLVTLQDAAESSP